jgi:cytochrome c biogenesis protein CcdA
VDLSQIPDHVRLIAALIGVLQPFIAGAVAASIRFPATAPLLGALLVAAMA